jgi:hypothetical protein
MVYNRGYWDKYFSASEIGFPTLPNMNLKSTGTNSPLESFNNLIKTQFMKKIVISIGGPLSKLEEIIIYFSNNRKKFCFSPRFVKALSFIFDQANALASSLTKQMR